MNGLATREKVIAMYREGNDLMISYQDRSWSRIPYFKEKVYQIICDLNKILFGSVPSVEKNDVRILTHRLSVTLSFVPRKMGFTPSAAGFNRRRGGRRIRGQRRGNPAAIQLQGTRRSERRGWDRRLPSV